MHATAYLKNPAKHTSGPVVALYGPERFLKQNALRHLCVAVLGEEDASGITKFQGKDAVLSHVLDELLTVSMFGDRRLVLVEDADDFVKATRTGLEKYLERPSRKSVLVLDVKTWPSTTRLAKKVAEIGLDLDCSALKPGELMKWLPEHAQAAHGKQLSRESAQTLVELAGTDLGLLDQELAKLAAYVGDKPKIDPQAVRALVGGWKAETTWSMLDAVRDGRMGVALQLLDKLLTAGEHPLKLLGGVNYSFRPLAHATEAARQGGALRTALQQSGVRPQGIDAAMNYLRRLGRPKAERLLGALLSADGDLKGNSPLPERIVFEKLLLQLAGKIDG